MSSQSRGRRYTGKRAAKKTSRTFELFFSHMRDLEQITAQHASEGRTNSKPAAIHGLLELRSHQSATTGLAFGVGQRGDLLRNQPDQKNDHGCGKQQYAHVGKTMHGDESIQVVAEPEQEE